MVTRFQTLFSIVNFTWIVLPGSPDPSLSDSAGPLPAGRLLPREPREAKLFTRLRPRTSRAPSRSHLQTAPRMRRFGNSAFIQIV